MEHIPERKKHDYRAVREGDGAPVPLVILRMRTRDGGEELPGLENVRHFPQVTLWDGGGALPRGQFEMPIYGPSLTNFLDVLERSLRSLPALVHRNRVKESLSRAHGALLENSQGLSDWAVNGLRDTGRLSYVYLLTTDHGRFATDFTVGYYLDPHLSAGTPSVTGTIFEQPEGGDSRRLYAFTITNPLRFFVDLKHYDPRLGYCLKGESPQSQRAGTST
jgi:hypothetical protein